MRKHAKHAMVSYIFKLSLTSTPDLLCLFMSQACAQVATFIRSIAYN